MKKLYVLCLLVACSGFWACEQTEVLPQQQVEFKLQPGTAVAMDCGMMIQLTSGNKIYDETLPNGFVLTDGMEVELAFTRAAKKGSKGGCNRQTHNGNYSNQPAVSERAACYAQQNIREVNIHTIRKAGESGH
ncbi:MAG: hypothetical protein D6730_18830 [Bacteroidetes bacterium]|nr:MAG: hypothetical protein D6730_18830 [Bacteroidota bacterium]